MKRNIIIAISVIALLILIGFRVMAKTQTEAQSKAAGAARKNAPSVVNLATAGPKDIGNIVQAAGTLESPYQVNLSPNISGRIDYLQVREGDPVKAGEVLARIDPQYVEAQILQAQGNVAAAQENLSKAKITEAANTVQIDTTIGQNKAGVSSAEADYNETVVTYDATVAAAHEATVDAQAKVASAYSAIQTSEANLHLAQANLEDAQAKYTRTYNLYQQGFDSPQDLDDQRAAVKVNQATVAAQEKDVEAAKSAWNSAKAEYSAAANEEAIAKKKGISDIADAKSKLVQAQQTLDSAVANRAQIPAYTENLRALESQVVAAKATLNQAIAQRAYLIVTSPIDGTVTRRLMDPGAEATSGSPLLTVQYLRELFVTASLPVEDSDQIHMGMDESVTLDAIPGRVFHGKIVYINKSADPTSRQFMVRTQLDNSEGILRPGMYATVQIITSYVHAPVAVPREAVATDANNNSTVTLVDSSNTAHVTPVTLGAQDATNIQILSGLKGGEKVVVLAYRPVPDGGKVKVGSWGLKGTGSHQKGGAAPSGAAATTGGGGGDSGVSGTTGTGGGSPSTPGAIGGVAGGTAGASTTETATTGTAATGTGDTTGVGGTAGGMGAGGVSTGTAGAGGASGASGAASGTGGGGR
jgi:RND family efflux transporter MFP subunit